MVNAIPETAIIETYVRGKSFEAMVENNKKINRALTGAALSIGANIEIIDIPGYAPLVNNDGMKQVALDAARLAMPDVECGYSPTTSTGSTDMGDLCCIMPVVHPYAAGSTGKSHGNDYSISDPETACVTNAKWQLAMVSLLLGDGARRAKKIIADFTPMFASKEDYLAYVDGLNSRGDRIVYGNDGAASVRID